MKTVNGTRIALRRPSYWRHCNTSPNPLSMASTTQARSSRFREEFDLDVFPFPASDYVDEHDEPKRKKQKTLRKLSKPARETMELTLTTINWLKQMWYFLGKPTVDGDREETTRLEPFSDEEIAVMQEETFGNFSERSLSATSDRHDSGLNVEHGPKGEIVKVIVKPPSGNTWEGIERAKASAVRRKRWLEVEIPGPISWDLAELDLSSWEDIQPTDSRAASKHDSTAP